MLILLMDTAGFMKQCNASNASYLFQPDKLNAEYDLGDKTIQCGRRADAFKLWLAWKVGAAASRDSATALQCPVCLSSPSGRLQLQAEGCCANQHQWAAACPLQQHAVCCPTDAASF